MSDYEFYQGKLRVIDVPQNLTIEKQIEYLKAIGHDITGEYDIKDGVIAYQNPQETKVFYHKGEWYCIYDNKDLKPHGGIYQANKRGKCIEYMLKYYNGSCCFAEAMDEALSKMKKDK